MTEIYKIFKASVALFARGRGLCDVHCLRFTSGVTPADLVTLNMAAGRLPHMRVSAEVGCRIRSGDLPHSSLTIIYKIYKK